MKIYTRIKVKGAQNEKVTLQGNTEATTHQKFSSLKS